MPQGLVWYVEKYRAGTLRQVAGPFGQYQTAHHKASEWRRIYGRLGWSYAVVKRARKPTWTSQQTCR